MKNLKTFSAYVKNKRLREYAKEYLRIVMSLDIPLVKLVMERNLFPDLNSEKGLEMIMASQAKFLTSLEDGTCYENARKSLQDWEQDKIAVPGFARSDIKPADLVLVYTAQREALLEFLPDYCSNVKESVAIMSELEHYYMTVQKEGVQILFKIQKETEEQLKESEEKFNRAFFESPTAIAISTYPDGKYIDVNESFLRMAGYTNKEEILGRTSTEIGMIADEQTRSRILKELQEHGSVSNFEVEIINKSGEKLHMLSSNETIMIRGRKCFLSTNYNISDRKIIEQKLADNEKKFRGLLESAPDAMVISNKDGVIELINAQTEKLFGYSKGELTGQKVEILIPKKYQDVHPKHRKNYFAEPKPRGMGIGLELFGKRKDGTEFPVEISLSPLQTAEGILVSAAIRDISVRKEVEKKLKESEAIFRLIVQAVKDYAIYFLDVNGNIKSWNEGIERIKGYKEEEVLGKHFSIFYTEPDKRRGIPQHNLEMARKLGHYESEGYRLRKDGTRFWANSVITPLYDEKGNLKGFSKVTRDSSEIKKAKEELESKAMELARSNTELEQFAYVASHDLQEPLRTISSYVQLLASRYGNKLDEDAKEFINYAVDGSNRMRQLISSLLEYSRINRVKPFEHIDMEDLVRGALVDMKELIKATGAVIKYDNLPSITGDIVLMGRLIQNLVANALKFRGDKKPEIIISGEKRNDDYLFSVKDNGIGIQKEYWDKIFVIFQRLNNREEYPGTGIGLSICKKIVERHGGKIWVESEPGKGSIFYFTLKHFSARQAAEMVTEHAKQD